MSVYEGINPILIGSRKYGVYSPDTDYDYMLLVSENRIPDILSIWSDKEITEFRNPKRYRIRGRLEAGDPRTIGDTPAGSMYDLTVIPKPNGIPDDKFINENWRIQWMIKITNVSPDINDEMKRRLTVIKKWAKDNGVYGGAYPDGIGYFLYTLNTLNKGYTLDTSLQMLHQRCLYYHSEYKYTHINYVADKSFAYIRNLIHRKDIKYNHQVQIITDKMEDALHATKYLLDGIPGNVYINNDGMIFSQKPIITNVNKWINEMMRDYSIHISIEEL